MGGCITSAKYNMTALVLPQGVVIEVGDDGEPTGHWEYKRDPVTGDVDRVWVIDPEPDDPDTPTDESMRGARTIVCQVNAIITGGLNSQGTTERWTSKGGYENVDFVELRTPPHIVLKRRDRVTNLAGPDGSVLWLEEDHPVDGTFPATVFQVRGSAPSLDIFNRHIENFVLLERAENQELNPGGTNG